MRSDQNMSEVVVNGASGWNMWFVTSAFTYGDLLLRPKYRERRSEGGRGGRGVRRKLERLGMAST